VLYVAHAMQDNVRLRYTIAELERANARARSLNAATESNVIANRIDFVGRTIDAHAQSVASLATVHDRIAHALERIGQSEVWGGISIDVDLTRAPKVPRMCDRCGFEPVTHDRPGYAICEVCARKAGAR
jgi:hypothetical protein